VVFALAIDPQSSSTLYATTFSQGVFKSVDGGQSWIAVNTGLTSPDVRAIAIDPQTTTTLYAGTGYTDPRNFRGVFKSVDGGSNWIAVGLDGLSISGLAVDPQTPTTLYVGVDRSAVVDGTQGPGVYKSTDSGMSWTAMNNGLTTPSVLSLATNPQIPSMIFAGTAGGGVFESTDGGTSWNPVNDGLTNPFVYALAIAPQTATSLYAGTGGGVFRITLTNPYFTIAVRKTGLGKAR
jgi:photosystem II stability/assembly factor-like uncharacterized protein